MHPASIPHPGRKGKLTARPVDAASIALAKEGWQKRLENRANVWEIPTVHTITADKAKRVRIPDAKPGQVFAYISNGDGSITLTPVEAAVKEPFPEGSLKHLVTEESNAEMAALARGIKIPAPPEDWD